MNPEIPDFVVVFPDEKTCSQLGSQAKLALKPGRPYRLPELVAKTKEDRENVAQLFAPYIKLNHIKRPREDEKKSRAFHLTRKQFDCIPVRACFCLLKDNHIRLLTFYNLEIRDSTVKAAGKGVYAAEDIPKGAAGVYRGLAKTFENMNASYSWTILPFDSKGDTIPGEPLFYRDASNFNHSNWTRYVNCADRKSKLNMDIDQIYDKVFYVTNRRIKKGEELFVDYGEEYRKVIGIEDRFFRKN